MSLFKSLPTILFLALTTISSATTYYVATTGDDNNQGNKEYPFKTLNKAWSVVTAGDTVFLRGGTYNNSIMPPNTYFRNKNGTSSDPIVISNYQNEKPILNYNCLLYTSDAADDLLCVDLGGRRILKKKNKKQIMYKAFQNKK